MGGVKFVKSGAIVFIASVLHPYARLLPRSEKDERRRSQLIITCTLVTEY